MGGEPLDPPRGGVVESGRPIWVAPDARVDLLVLLGGRDRLLAPGIVDADAEHPADADPARLGDQLSRRRLAEPQVAVGVDHGSGSPAASVTGFGGAPPTVSGAPSSGAP
jgi:hypothetical protein